MMICHVAFSYTLVAIFLKKIYTGVECGSLQMLAFGR